LAKPVVLGDGLSHVLLPHDIPEAHCVIVTGIQRSEWSRC
jgi:hypothetical protein